MVSFSIKIWSYFKRIKKQFNRQKLHCSRHGKEGTAVTLTLDYFHGVGLGRFPNRDIAPHVLASFMIGLAFNDAFSPPPPAKLTLTFHPVEIRFRRIQILHSFEVLL